MAELGTKFECAECSTKFYDLGNPGAVCPKCETPPRRDGNEIERRAPIVRVKHVEEEAEVPVVDDNAVEDVVEDLDDVVDPVDED